MHQIRVRLQIFAIVFVVVMVLGTFGFMAIEGVSLYDAFYFSIVTIATVGYGDIHPVTPIGKLFAVFLIVMGVGTFLGVIANVTELILSRRERQAVLEKLNMVIGVFFSEVGTRLLVIFSDSDPKLDRIRADLIVKRDWTGEDFSRVDGALRNYQYDIVASTLNLSELRGFLLGKRDFLVRLLENPVLLEHEAFTELLRAVFHITEELDQRQDCTCLPDSDRAHISGDVRRAYRLLVHQWLDYMRHLKDHYPYLFSLAMRTNPFDQEASPVVMAPPATEQVDRSE